MRHTYKQEAWKLQESDGWKRRANARTHARTNVVELNGTRTVQKWYVNGIIETKDKTTTKC
jgi:hypothetical protein